MNRFYTLLATLCGWLLLMQVGQPAAYAANPEETHGGKLKVSELLFHHILDAHDWEITELPAGKNPDGTTHYVPFTLHLPYLVYNSERGLEFFSLTGHTLAEKQTSASVYGYELDAHEHLHPIVGHARILDFSITKTVLQMLLVAMLLVLVFTAVARSFNKNAGKAPRGLQSFFEPIIVFIRDDIAKPNLPGNEQRFLPYLLTLFFFIWFANLFGLTPFNSNIAGNISVTVALAFLTFILVQFNGSKDYWQHIFWYPGVPFLVKLILLPVEFIGIFTRPFALTVRLFANIAGGHFMVLSLISLIFILYGSMGHTGAFSIAPLSVLFTVIIMLLELLVAIIQAYVFTLLTAVFIGQAMESHSKHNAEASHH